MESAHVKRGHACAVAIIGGGPAGSTLGSLLRVHDPSLSVIILEKERFPREHVGESQLPPINGVLDEMGAWEKVEAAGFPIKIGASYTWGKSPEQWDFDLYPIDQYEERPRPGTLDSQRRLTTFQVDRAIYDTILLDHAAELGCDVRQGTRVTEVRATGDHVDALVLDDGSTVTAQHYVDASGTVGILRRAMGVHSDVAQTLRNIAIWQYWEGVPWAVAIGNATRVQVRSIGFGWLWYIPISQTRASCGLVCPADYYKQRGLSPQAIYAEALAKEPRIANMLAQGTPSGPIHSAKDWSQLSERLQGENWWLCGETAGFADPILAAGMTLAHQSARDLACTILELRRGHLDQKWLRDQYNDRTRRSIQQHIQFAEYWYASNGQFTDLQEHCAKIAKETGLNLSPQQAWAWLAQGGFTNADAYIPLFGSYDLAAARRVMEIFSGQKHGFSFDKFNVLGPNLEGAQPAAIARYHKGRVERIEGLQRGHYFVAYRSHQGLMMKFITQTPDINQVFALMQQWVQTETPPAQHPYYRNLLIQTLESLVLEGWVATSVNPDRPMLQWEYAPSRQIKWAKDNQPIIESRWSEPPTRRADHVSNAEQE